MNPAPRPPVSLTPEAREAWRAIAPRLARRGLLEGRDDRRRAAVMCSLWVIYRQILSVERVWNRKLRQDVERMRALIRRRARDFYLVGQRRGHLAPIGLTGGEDLELAAIFRGAGAVRGYGCAPSRRGLSSLRPDDTCSVRGASLSPRSEAGRGARRRRSHPQR